MPATPCSGDSSAAGEFLCFYQLGRSKCEWFAIDYPLRDTQPSPLALTSGYGNSSGAVDLTVD